MVDLNRLEAGNAWKHIGMEIIENSKGQLGVRIRNSDRLKQVYGNIHGGMLAIAVDSAMAVAVNKEIGSDNGAVTVELKINFLRAVSDSDIYAYAELVKQGKQLMIGTVDVFDEGDNLVAIGSSTYMIKSLSQ